jgi:hypothetical protein
MKKILFVLAISALFLGNNTGCKNRGKLAADSTKVSITVDSFLASPEKWAGKDVVIIGTVSHVCRHSGKKLFLFGANPEKIVKITAGGDHTTFDIKYEGNDVEVKGTVVEDEKIDANYLNDWEKEIKAMVGDKEQKVCNEESKAISTQKKCDTTKVKEAVDDPYAPVKEFRKKLEESGKTYISIYAITCKTMKELKKEEPAK